MNTEHIVALVEPTVDGESTLELAKQAVDRGGRATVVVLLTRATNDDIRNFAEAEDLTIPDAREIFIERLTDGYSAQLGEGDAAVVALSSYSGRSLMKSAQSAHATTIAMPQSMSKRFGWRSPIARSAVPVVISPPRAA